MTAMTRARLVFGVALLLAARAGWAQSDPALTTVAERSDYKATARHDDVCRLCAALAERSDAVRLVELGRSVEDRPIPMLVVADPMVASPEDARRSGKLVVLAIGNIHAGEVDGKEGLPMLVRELTDRPGHPLLKDVILAVVPNYNPDGNERVGKGNRPGQVGPEEGMGRRENAQGFDLNRDFVKLEAPESRALVRWIADWNPDIFIDTHTTNGSHHRYTITHAGPKCPAGDRRVIDYVHTTLLPAVDSAMDREHGIKTFPYGNFEDDHTRWTTYGAQPRYSTSYVGLRNRIAVLSEAYAYAPYRDRVLATRDFVRSILEFAADHRGEIRTLLDEAAKGGVPGEPVAIRSVMCKRPEPRTALGFVERNEDGHTVATEESRDYTVEVWDDFAPAESVTRPAAYIVPASCGQAVEVLQRHGLNLSALGEDVRLNVEAFQVEAIERAAREYQGHRSIRDIRGETRAETRLVPAGSVLVPATGPLGSLAVMLLEPRSEDGLATWGFFDEGLAEGRDFPVLRVPKLPGVAPRLAAVRPLPGAPRQERRRLGSDQSPPLRIGRGMHATVVPGAAGFVRWLDDDHYAQIREGKTYKVEARTGDAEPMPAQEDDRAKLAEALGKLPTIGEGTAPGRARRARLDESKSGAFIAHEDDLYYGRLDGSKAIRLTSTPGAEELAEFSPDGAFVAFVRDNDLYVVDVETGTERALTTGGTDRTRNGKADWVYFEEIFDRDWKAYWWSPDSKRIAFLAIDDRMVPTHHVLSDIGPKRLVEETAYPRAGEPNPHVALGLVEVAGGAPRYANTSDYSADSFLISGVGWWPDGSSAYAYAQDRAQTWLDVLKVPVDGATTRLFRETTGAWVESLGDIHVLKNGDLLILSERDGWKHLYRYGPDGTLKNRVTEGDWEVREVSRIDEDGGWVYLNGTKDNPIGGAIYRAKLDGTALERLSDGDGTHAASFNPGGSLFVDVGSSREQSPRATLREADGTKVRTLDAGSDDGTSDRPAGPRREIVQIETKDGAKLDAEVILPADLDESGKTLYPVWFTTYGGPHFPTISDVWRGGPGGNPDLLREGFILFRMDPRSASGKGAKSAWTAYRKLGVQELEDIQEAIAWLKQRPYVDGSRIGMSGHSYGGFLTAFCMTHSDLFAAGIAGAPVTDWRDYDSIYTERFMDTPQNNPEGYDASSVVKAASKLHGRLLILHGGIDDNVSVRNTMRFIHALQQADKDFELMIYPAARHGIFGPHYSRLQREFIKRTLGGPKPRDESSNNGRAGSR
jgi:dipeptidyl-peptidase-4